MLRTRQSDSAHGPGACRRTHRRFFTEQIKQLGVAHGNQEVKAVIGIAHNEK